MNPYTTNPVVDKDRLHAIKLRIQDFFQSNTVLIIGLGPSAALGLPTMSELASTLKAHLKDCLTDKDISSWSQIVELLDKGVGLEQALQSADISDELYSHIVQITGQCVGNREGKAIEDLMSDNEMPALSCLLKNLSIADRKLNVVTTNYDRLIEVQAEIAGLGIDVGYPGQFASSYNPMASKRSHQRLDTIGNKPRILTERHVRLFKPHGSLDWMRTPDSVRRSLAIRIPEPVIIAPGVSKYRAGYKEHFALEREGASRALRMAQRYIAIGYGFNDDQLEESWCPGLKCDKPLLIVTMDLTENAVSVARNSKETITVSLCRENTNYTNVQLPGEPELKVNCDLWSLSGFVSETIKHEQ